MNTSNAWLEVKWGAEVGKSYPLSDRADVVLGQGDTLSISQESIAQPQFRITRDKGGYRLSDPANAGGILVNGGHLRWSHLLQDVDEIAVPPTGIWVFHAQQPSPGEAPTEHISDLEATITAESACPKCGTVNPETAINCANCGINLGWARTHLEVAGGGEYQPLTAPSIPDWLIATKGKDLGSEHQPLKGVGERVAKAQERISEQGRPGWVTAIAVLQFIGGLFNIFVGLSILDVSLAMGVFVLVLDGVGFIVLSMGLWQMREWGRVGTLIVRVFDLIVGAVSAINSGGGITGLIISLIIIIYLARGETAKKFR